MIKKILLIVITLCFFIFPGIVGAQASEVNLYFFRSNTCPHCAKEKVFLDEITPRYPNLIIHDYEISIRDNVLLLQKIGKELNIETTGVPITIIGNDHFIGYGTDETTGKLLISLIEKTAQEKDPDIVGKIIKGEEINNPPTPTIAPTASPAANLSPTGVLTMTPTQNPQIESPQTVIQEIQVPILGTINPKNLSLPALTVITGLLDGFNPCAMWVLLFLISLLLGMKDRKRMFILGGSFIFASALVYFLFLSAWLNLFLFLGFITWIRALIGIVALGAGIYYLYDFFKNKSAECNIVKGQRRQKIFDKIRTLAEKKQLFIALVGIVSLAFAVNLVELICSAGLPAIYTQVLSLSNLPAWKYYLYLLIYVVIFMIDDLIIFFTAMVTLHATGIQSKYTRFSHLIGGILMFIIGTLLIFKPEILMFS